MSEDRSYIDQNTRERERLRGLVERLDEEALRAPVNEHWTVAAVLGHIAFWDARVLALRIAEETDARVANLPVERLWPRDPSSPLNPLRAAHRGEHLDEIEAVTRSSSESDRGSAG